MKDTNRYAFVSLYNPEEDHPQVRSLEVFPDEESIVSAVMSRYESEVPGDTRRLDVDEAERKVDVPYWNVTTVIVHDGATLPEWVSSNPSWTRYPDDVMSRIADRTTISDMLHRDRVA